MTVMDSLLSLREAQVNYGRSVEQRVSTRHAHWFLESLTARQIILRLLVMQYSDLK